MQENEKLKRPASHRWAIGIFAFMTVGFAMFLIDVVMGRSGTNARQFWLPIAFLSVAAFALFALVVGRRQQWAYYVTSGSLAVWTGRAVYTLFLYAYHFFVDGNPVSTPYFHLAERDKPFVVQQHVSFPRQLLLAVAVGLLVWLSICFAFGRPSRSYYQFRGVMHGISG